MKTPGNLSKVNIRTERRPNTNITPPKFATRSEGAIGLGESSLLFFAVFVAFLAGIVFGILISKHF